MTVVTGPPGSGKSTLLEQYAAAHAGQVARYALTETPAAPEDLLTEIHTALVTQAGVPRAPGAGASLLSVVEQLTAPVTLVLDDVHLVEGTPAETVIVRLAAMLPRRSRLLLASRTTLSWLVNTLEEGVDVRLLDAEDLRFRSWEVEQLFGSHFQEPLPPEDAAALSRETEGWAAGLRMFYLSTSGKPLAERRHAVAQLWGKASLLTSYLTQNVLAGQPADIVEFLIETSALVDLEPAICNEYLSRRDSFAILDRLAEQQLFTIRTGAHSYRYHAVLQGQLEAMLVERLDDEAARSTYRRAATALEDAGHDRAAMRAWIRAGDWGAAEKIRQRLSRPASTTSTDASYLHAGLDGDPWVQLSEARRLVAAGRLAAAREAYHRAEADLIDPTARAGCRSERAAVEAFLGIGAPFAQERSRDWAVRLRAATRAEPARLWTEIDPETSDGWRLASAVAAMLDGNFKTGGEIAVGLLEAGTDAMRLAGQFLTCISGGFSGASDVAAELDEIALAAELAGQLFIARLANAQRAFFDPSCADDARAVVAECDAIGDHWGALLTGLAQAIGVALDGNDFMPLFDDVADRADALDAPVLKCWVRAIQALAAARSDHRDAPALIRDAEISARLAGVPAARALLLYSDAELNPASSARLAELADVTAAANGWTAAKNRVGPTTLLPRTRSPEEPPAARLRCLGGYALELHGREVNWRSLRPRVATMLRLLSLRAGVGIHEEMLIDALWREQPLDRGRHNLQAAISSLRQMLEPGRSRGEPSIVERVGETYALVLPTPHRIDVNEFRDAIDTWQQARFDGSPASQQIPVLQQVMATYAGELLPEDGPAEWVVDERERLRLDAAAAAVALADLHHLGGDSGAAIRAADWAIQVDATRDDAWRILLQVYEQRGDIAAVERTRRRYAEVLDDLGVPKELRTPR